VVTPSESSASRRGSAAATSPLTDKALVALTEETIPPRARAISSYVAPFNRISNSRARLPPYTIVGMAIDEAGCDPAAFKIVDFGSFDCGRWQFAFWTGKDDASPVRHDSTLFNDAESLAALGKGRQTRIAPKADFALG